MVGSVHHVFETPTDFDSDLFNDAVAKSPEKTPDSVYQGYFDSQYEIITQLKPKIIGHFDVIRMYTPEEKISNKTWEKIKRNVDAVNAYGGIFEINSRAWKKNLEYAYPFKDILQVSFCLFYFFFILFYCDLYSTLLLLSLLLILLFIAIIIIIILIIIIIIIIITIFY